MQFLRYNQPQSNSLRKLAVALLGMIIVICSGMIGFMAIEHMNSMDALYMTVIIFSTVGFGEVVPLHPEGKILVIFLILFGAVLAGYTVSVIGQMVLEGQFHEIFGRKKIENRIKKLSGHYIIAGFGRVGRQVARGFARRKVDFVVIEKEADGIEEVLAEGYLTVDGEATVDDVLRRAGIERAHTLVSTLPDEAQNVYLTLTARYMNKELQIIARDDHEEGEIKLSRAGANHVISPHVLGGSRMTIASLRPNVVDFMHMTALGEGGLSLEELVIPTAG